MGQWFTLALTNSDKCEYALSYRELEPASYYVFRVYARNHVGIGRPSPQSEQLQVPGKNFATKTNLKLCLLNE